MTVLLLVFFLSTLRETASLYIRSREDHIYQSRELKSSTRSFNFSKATLLADPKGKNGDRFGEAIAIENNVALVASPIQSDYPLYEAADGKVFIFIDTSSSNEWTLIREVMGEDASEYFGSAVALHETNQNYFAVVGASHGNRYGQFSGGAYYFDVQLNPQAEQDYPKH